MDLVIEVTPLWKKKKKKTLRYTHVSEFSQDLKTVTSFLLTLVHFRNHATPKICIQLPIAS
jgi:hypothetical protein